MDAPLKSVRNPPLDYAQPAPWIRRRAARRMMLALAGVALFGASWSIGPRLWRCAQLWYWQRQCLSYVADGQSDIAKAAPPVAWKKFSQLLDGSSSRGVGTAFVHEMHKPGGEKRLVVVEAYLIGPVGMAPSDIMPVARIFAPGNLLRPPREILSATTAPRI